MFYSQYYFIYFKFNMLNLFIYFIYLDMKDNKLKLFFKKMYNI
jgi:hypothetical protein